MVHQRLGHFIIPCTEKHIWGRRRRGGGPPATARSGTLVFESGEAACRVWGRLEEFGGGGGEVGWRQRGQKVAGGLWGGRRGDFR